MQIADLLHQASLARPASIAVMQGCQMLTYLQLQEHVLQMSRCLVETGCAAGIKVGLFLHNCPEYLIAFFAISDTHSTIVPLSREMTFYELRHKAETMGISVIISDQAGCCELKKATFDYTLISITLDESLEIERFREDKTTFNADNENTDVALMISTSGCTGNPKHVMLTDAQLIANMQSYQKVMPFQQGQVVYCVLPFFHIYSISAQILTHISLGDTLWIPEHPFFVKEFFQAVQEHNVTISAFVPYYAILMAQFPRWKEYDLSSLQNILLAGGKTPIETQRLLREKYPTVKFINTYGLTEASPRVTIAGPQPLAFPVGSVGITMPGVSVKVIDDQDKELPSEEIGQIVVKSSSIMKGYYKQPVLTQEVLSADGWLRTGDMGKLDSEGNLYIEGRQKDVIISGGKNIYPYEIEECLLRHPMVAEAVVVSKSHPKLQEIPFAFIVSRKSTNIEFNDIIKHCRQYLSSYKIPQGFKLINTLPKISASKVDRRQLVRSLAEGLAI